jgi:4-carboxymuconolactone decarboxylase
MRLTLVPPAKLNSEQHPLYEDMNAGISAKYGAFTTMRDDGAILGPCSAWLQDPKTRYCYLVRYHSDDAL